MSDAGEVVTLAAWPVHFAIGGRVADAAPTVAVASPTAGALALLSRALAGAGAQGALVTFAAGPHVPRAADTHPALERASPLVAFWAVHLGLCLAVAAALGINLHFQCVTQPHWFYHNMLSVFFARGEADCHIERDLEEKSVAVQSCSTCSSAGWSGSTCRGQNKRVLDTARIFCNLCGGKLSDKVHTFCFSVLNSLDFMYFENSFLLTVSPTFTLEHFL